MNRLQAQATTQNNIILVFAAAILAAVMAVAVASVLIANRIDAIAQQPSVARAHSIPATTTSTEAQTAAACVVPDQSARTSGSEGAVLGAVSLSGHHTRQQFGSHSHSTHNSHTHGTSSTSTSSNYGNTGNTGVVNTPINVSDNNVLNDNNVLSNNTVEALNSNDIDTDVPILNLVENQAGPTGILTSLL